MAEASIVLDEPAAVPNTREKALLLPRIAGLFAILALVAAVIGGGSRMPLVVALAAVLAIIGLRTQAFARASAALAAITCIIASAVAGYALVFWLEGGAQLQVSAPAFWCLLVSAWLLAWSGVDQLARLEPVNRVLRTIADALVPLLFGVWLLILWECLTRGLQVPSVLLPPPTQIAERFVSSTSILWADFQQTFLKAVLIGWSMGCAAGFVVALLIDRSSFLKRGLIPIGNLVSALPIVGLAPIMVMWFGFDWPSKAAVVIIMTFFPMLVNTVAGLAASDTMQRDLMNTYAASPGQSLLKLRLPLAMPFIFNALKINSTLALIGAIVAEFFGTPTVGMGFRISTEVGRMNVDMVWAEIAVAAVAGSVFYGVLALIERLVTFWHPSIRNRGATR